MSFHTQYLIKPLENTKKFVRYKNVYILSVSPLSTFLPI